MTAINVAALRAAAEGATPGPWLARYGGVVHSIREALAEAVVYNVPCACGEDVKHVTAEDADHIAAANPAVVLALLDRLAAAEAAVERAACALDDQALALMATSADNPTGNALTAAVVSRCAAIVRREQP